MKCLLLLFVVIALASCTPTWSRYKTNLSTDNFKTAFEDFKVKFNKHYDQKDEPHRFDIFSDNYMTIVKHNEEYDEGKTGYKMTVTRFSDMTKEEYIKFLEDEAGGKTLPPWW